MNKKIVGLIAMMTLAPVGASAMPAGGLAPAAVPQSTVDGAKLDRVVLAVRVGGGGFRRGGFRRGPAVIVAPRRGFVGRPGFRRGGFGVRGPGVGIGIGRRGGVGIRIR